MIRIRLLKRWKHPYKKEAYIIGTVLQPTLNLAHELIADEIAEIYNGDYPPKRKDKMKIERKNLKTTIRCQQM